VETRLSIRTRVLDYIWARLPILITDGDITSEWVRQYKIGKVVQPFDEKEVAQALLEMLGKPKSEYAAYFSPLHETYTWERVVEPLRRFCLEGQPAPDRERLRRQALSQSQPVVWRWRFSRAWYILCRRGGRELAHRLWRYIQWRYHSRTTGE
jgi:hypothetical protein